MPHIFITHDVPDSVLRWLARNLPIICAEYLGCNDEGGELTKDNFTVTFHKKGDFDILTHPLEIRVEAHSFPGRLANIDDRTEKIRDAIRAGCEHRNDIVLRDPGDIPPGKPFGFYVWVRLTPAGLSAGEIVPLE